jgi:hypothetical protein
MNQTIYHTVDVTLDPTLPKPAIRDVAEVFGIAVGQIDHSYGIKPVDPQHGVYRIGTTGVGTQQIQSGSQRRNARISQDFYAHP